MQIVSEYGFPKETVNTKIMFYKNTKAMVRLLDGDTNYFGIVTGVL